MAVLGKFDAADVDIGGTDVSSFVRSVTINVNRSEEDISAMGDSWSEFTIGRGEWDVTLELWQSFYTSEVDATLWPLLNAPGSGVTITIIPDGTSATAVNPSYSGTVFATGYTPMDGSFDENLSTSISLRGSGTLTRATS
jgi:hypothetical protein